MDNEENVCYICTKILTYEVDSIETKDFGKLCKTCYEKYRGKSIKDLFSDKKMLNEDQVALQQFRTKILTFLTMKERGKATEAVVGYILNKHRIKTIREDKTKELWIYNAGIYLPNAITYILEECRTILDEIYTTTFANQVVDKIQTLTFIDKEVFFNKQNEFPYLICVKNGLLDIKTRKLLKFTPDIYFFNKIDIEYHDSAKCPKILEFLKQITAKDDDVDVIQEMFGFSLIKDYKYEKAFMLFGEHGRNGKSKLLGLLKAMLGLGNISSITLNDLEEDQFCIADLHNKLVNIAADIDSTDIKRIGILKALTGRDPIQANRKFLSRIQFTNYAKMIFACNELPTPKTNSDAFWLRWVLIEFPYQFLPQKEINSIPEDDRKHVRLQDTDILQKIMTESELEGLLAWSLCGLDRLDNNRDFSNKETKEDIKLNWKRKSNSVAAFIQDNIIESFGDDITKADFRQRYNEYCDVHRIKKLSDMVIKITLQNEFGINGDVKRVGEKKIYTWENIKFIDDRPSFESMMQDKYNMYAGAEIDQEQLTELLINNNIKDVDKYIQKLVLDGVVMELQQGVFKVL